MTGKVQIIGLDKSELEDALKDMGEKPFRAKQIWQWLYFRGVQSFDEMTNLSKPLRIKLDERFVLERPKIIESQISKDKTHKWLLEFADGARVETVYIPEADRGAVCISTQVGCAMGCKFCLTGTQKLTRNLSAGEIVSQFMIARDAYGEWPSPTETTRYLSNIVVMGMGEPLQNKENVIKALNFLSDGDGIAIGGDAHRRAGGIVAGDDAAGNRRLQFALDRAADRARAVDRVEAGLRECRDGLGRDVELEFLCLKT